MLQSNTSRWGWEGEDTSAKSDQGIDQIASTENIRVCIQCKCFQKVVGNKAMQEIVQEKLIRMDVMLLF